MHAIGASHLHWRKPSSRILPAESTLIEEGSGRPPSAHRCFDLRTGQWQKTQIPYSWPELDVENGILRIHSEQDGQCILTCHDDWAWAECLLPDVPPEERVMPRGGTAAVRFLGSKPKNGCV